MADNTSPQKSGSQPPLPSSGMTGRLPSPATTHLPVRKGGAGKIVVMLSSVAKPPPARTQLLQSLPPRPDAPPKLILSEGSQAVRCPPPLPPKQVAPAAAPLSQPRLSATTHVKLPPKTSEPRWSSLSGTPVTAARDVESPLTRPVPPPLPVKPPESNVGEPRKSGAQHIRPIKLNESMADASGDSIFPGVFQPGSRPGLAGVKPAEAVRPPPLAKFSEGFVIPPAPLHVAPPLLEKTPELPSEKLPQPHLPVDVRPGEISPPSSPGFHQVPALIQPEAPPDKSLVPPVSPAAKGPGSWLKQTAPLVLSSSAKVPPVAEAKPALKPAVLPKRSFPDFPSAEAAGMGEKPEITAPAAPAAPVVPVAATAPAVSAAHPSRAVPVSTSTTKPPPETRAARAKKRRLWETVFFYVLFAITLGVLFFGGLYFCRETRLEGQVIPPSGMTLNNEVWIVSDFSELASGIAEDLAAERTPLMQEIQERQDHVQRAQADVASREERIRLIEQEIQASKGEIDSLLKQSREATQKIWDGEGAEIDGEYASHFNELQRAISDRAKSLNLKYQPDITYQSPEVWANAYRLALYEVPAGVDGVKEHQWLSDQMKAWRDFLKTLDDRKEQLREKAAQVKLAPASRINDLNRRIDELKQRADGTAAEEVPLKAELQQAQADLVQAQGVDAGLDDKYYKQLESLPGEAIIKRISLTPKGRFTWVDDDVFAEGEKEHRYWIFSRATRTDGRQYWALHHFSIGRYQTFELIIEPTGFISTKAILRPNLPAEEQEQ